MSTKKEELTIWAWFSDSLKDQCQSPMDHFYTSAFLENYKYAVPVLSYWFQSCVGILTLRICEFSIISASLKKLVSLGCVVIVPKCMMC